MLMVKPAGIRQLCVVKVAEYTEITSNAIKL